jgi:hypothetical protein
MLNRGGLWVAFMFARKRRAKCARLRWSEKAPAVQAAELDTAAELAGPADFVGQKGAVLYF